MRRDSVPAVVPPDRGGATAVRRFTGSWPSAGAWGAGLILAALGAGAIVGPTATPVGRAAGTALVVLGVAALVWGAVSLARGRLVVPRLGLAGALAGVLGCAALLATAPAHTSLLATGVASALLVFVGAASAVADRRRGPTPRDAGSPSLAGVVVAAALLAAVVTPALGSAQDAVMIRDDGTVPAVEHGH